MACPFVVVVWAVGTSTPVCVVRAAVDVGVEVAGVLVGLVFVLAPPPPPPLLLVGAVVVVDGVFDVLVGAVVGVEVV